MASNTQNLAFTPQYEPQLALLEEYCVRNPVPEVPPSSPALATPWPSCAHVMAWKAKDLDVDKSHVVHLSADGQKEVMSACAAFTGSIPSTPERHLLKRIH